MFFFFSGVFLCFSFFPRFPPPLFSAAARINGLKNPSFRAQRRAATELSSRPAFGHVARFNWRVRIEWTRGALWFAERGRFHAAWMKSPHQIPRAAEWGTAGTRGVLRLVEELRGSVETRSCLEWFHAPNLDRWSCDRTAHVESFVLVSLARRISVLRLIQIRILLNFSCISLPIWISICT